jgi:O-antigen/teichoic acid export membrane protein
MNQFEELPPPVATLAAGSLKQRATQGALWITLEILGVQGTSFAVFAIMAHFIEPRDFGLMAIGFVTVWGIRDVILDSMAVFLLRKQNATDIEYSSIFWLTILVGTISCLSVFLLAHSLESLLRMPGLAPVLRGMSVILILMALGRTHEAWLSRHFHFRTLALRGTAGSVAGAIVGIGLAFRGLGVMALIGQQIVSSFVALALLWTTCAWRPGFRVSSNTILEIFSFMGRIIPNGLIGLINSNCDTILIALFFGPISVGIYNVGKRVRLAVQIVVTGAINGVALPALAEMQADPAQLHRGLLSATALISVVCGPIFLGTAAVSKEVINVLFGSKWIDAAPVLELLSIAGVANSLIHCYNYILIINKRLSWSLYITILYCALAMFFFFVLLEMKMYLLALPFVLPYLMVFPLSLSLASWSMKRSILHSLRSLLPGIGSAAVMFMVVKLAGSTLLGGLSDWTRLAVLCPLGAVVYMGFLLLVGRGTMTIILDVLRDFFRHRCRVPASSRE